MEYYSESYNNLNPNVQKKVRDFIIDGKVEYWDIENIWHYVFDCCVESAFNTIQSINSHYKNIKMNISKDEIDKNFSDGLSSLYESLDSLNEYDWAIEFNYPPFEYYNKEHDEVDEIYIEGILAWEEWVNGENGGWVGTAGDLKDIANSFTIDSNYINNNVLMRYPDSVRSMMGKDVFEDFIDYLNDISTDFDKFNHEMEDACFGDSYMQYSDWLTGYKQTYDTLYFLEDAFKTVNPTIVYTENNRGTITITSIEE